MKHVKNGKNDIIFLKSFCVAGFQYYKGAFLFNEMTIGSKIDLVWDQENKHDDCAVMLCFAGEKIGYVPRVDNQGIAEFLKTGHSVFEGVVQQISPNEHPSQQIRVGIFIARIAS